MSRSELRVGVIGLGVGEAHIAGFERNPKLGPEVFRFTPPKGADIISD